jgi:type IV pilus assembly protein PilV
MTMHLPHRPSRRPAAARRQRGASLIEILVTVLILSFGLMGMSALQARALKGSVSSFQRSQAAIFSQYMLDVMRIDREKAKGGSYNTGKICNPNAFAGTALADTARKDWLTLVRDDMGTSADTTTCVAINCDADYKCWVTIMWDDSRAGGLATQMLTVSSRV